MLQQWKQGALAQGELYLYLVSVDVNRWGRSRRGEFSRQWEDSVVRRGDVIVRQCPNSTCLGRGCPRMSWGTSIPWWVPYIYVILRRAVRRSGQFLQPASAVPKPAPLTFHFPSPLFVLAVATMWAYEDHSARVCLVTASAVKCSTHLFKGRRSDLFPIWLIVQKSSLDSGSGFSFSILTRIILVLVNVICYGRRLHFSYVFILGWLNNLTREVS